MILNYLLTTGMTLLHCFLWFKAKDNFCRLLLSIVLPGSSTSTWLFWQSESGRFWGAISTAGRFDGENLPKLARDHCDWRMADTRPASHILAGCCQDRLGQDWFLRRFSSCFLGSARPCISRGKRDDFKDSLDPNITPTIRPATGAEPWM